MKRNIIISVISLCLLFSSCSEFLDLKPYGKTIPKTSVEFSALLHDYLNKIDYGTDHVLVGNFSDVLSYACFVDNLDASLTERNYRKVMPNYIGNRINSFQTLYGNLYSIIRDCNIIINRVTDADKSTQRGQEVLATAHTMRAVCYYSLVRHYCEPFDKGNSDNQLGVPLVEDFDIEARPLRSGLQNIINFVIDDLKKAIEYNVNKEEYRFTVDVAKAYLARMYFWSEDWNNAIEISKEIVNKYPLVDGSAYTNMIQDRYGKNGNVLLRSYIYSGGNDLTYETAELQVKHRPASKEFVDLFVEKENDIRYALSFNAERHNQKNLCARVRSAEFCLIVAESYAHISGKEADALLWLNKLREKRITPFVPYTLANLPVVNPDYIIKKDAEGKNLTPLMYSIITERQKELYLEMDRFFELKRNGRPTFWVAADGLKYVMEQFLYTTPIPKNDIELVSGLKQNKGYK